MCERKFVGFFLAYFRQLSENINLLTDTRVGAYLFGKKRETNKIKETTKRNHFVICQVKSFALLLALQVTGCARTK